MTFKDKQLGKAIPYGVYDMLNNQGWVSVGVDHDTAQFAGAQHSVVVARNGIATLSPSPAPVDHRRRRWQQQPPFPIM